MVACSTASTACCSWPPRCSTTSVISSGSGSIRRRGSGSDGMATEARARFRPELATTSREPDARAGIPRDRNPLVLAGAGAWLPLPLPSARGDRARAFARAALRADRQSFEPSRRAHAGVRDARAAGGSHPSPPLPRYIPHVLPPLHPPHLRHQPAAPPELAPLHAVAAQDRRTAELRGDR